MIGGMVPLARVGHDLVQHGASELLVPGHGALLRDHLDPGGLLALGLQANRDVAVVGRAIDLAPFAVLALFARRLGRLDLELVERLLRRGGRAVDGRGHDGLHSPLGKIDPAASPRSSGRHHARRGEHPEARGAPGLKTRRPGLVQHRVPACERVWRIYLARRLLGYHAYGQGACYPDHGTEGGADAILTAWNSPLGGPGYGWRRGGTMPECSGRAPGIRWSVAGRPGSSSTCPATG